MKNKNWDIYEGNFIKDLKEGKGKMKSYNRWIWRRMENYFLVKENKIL